MKNDAARACTHYDSPLGRMLIAATDDGVAGIWFVGQRHGPDSSGWRDDPAHPMLQRAIAELRGYFEGGRKQFTLPLDMRCGTPFQQSVWQALLAIPPGATSTYAELARRLGRPQAARAIGAAVGRNPVSIVVPCHRVLGTGGSLTGYAGGVERKAALLRLEGALAN
jgi:methylated-DNA-[protein]-cysteine S-methyltransferase